MLKPDVYSRYEQSLQEANDALTTVEDALTSLGMKLEYEHWRLGGAVEELKPLMIDTRSPSDKIMEAFEQRLPLPSYEHIQLLQPHHWHDLNHTSFTCYTGSQRKTKESLRGSQTPTRRSI